MKIDDLTSLYRGRVAEHIVAQELLSRNLLSLKLPHFWVREKRGADAEVDFIIQYKELLVPVELKSGKTGKLRSLHFFMDNVDHDCAVRLYNGRLSIDTSPGW